MNAIWGKLACEILMQNWDVALEDLNRLKETIESTVSCMYFKQTLQRYQQILNYDICYHKIAQGNHKSHNNIQQPKGTPTLKHVYNLPCKYFTTVCCWIVLITILIWFVVSLDQGVPLAQVTAEELAGPLEFVCLLQPRQRTRRNHQSLFVPTRVSYSSVPAGVRPSYGIVTAT